MKFTKGEPVIVKPGHNRWLESDYDDFGYTGPHNWTGVVIGHWGVAESEEVVLVRPDDPVLRDIAASYRDGVLDEGVDSPDYFRFFARTVESIAGMFSEPGLFEEVTP